MSFRRNAVLIDKNISQTKPQNTKDFYAFLLPQLSSTVIDCNSLSWALDFSSIPLLWYMATRCTQTLFFQRNDQLRTYNAVVLFTQTCTYPLWQRDTEAHAYGFMPAWWPHTQKHTPRCTQINTNKFTHTRTHKHTNNIPSSTLKQSGTHSQKHARIPIICYIGVALHRVIICWCGLFTLAISILDTPTFYDILMINWSQLHSLENRSEW